MRLIRPDFGECIDRLSILARKIEEGRLRDIETHHWEREEAEILNYMDGEGGHPFRPGRHILHLAAINAMIWDRQEIAKAFADDDVVEPKELLPELTRLNHRRAESVGFLNGETRGKEKL